MTQDALFNETDIFHRECLRFCFMDVIQAELNRIRHDWNRHNINKSRKNEHVPTGRPHMIYSDPERYNTRSYHRNINQVDINFLKQQFPFEFMEHGTLPDFVNLFHQMKPRLRMPRNATEGKALYLELLQLYNRYKDNL